MANPLRKITGVPGMGAMRCEVGAYLNRAHPLAQGLVAWFSHEQRQLGLRNKTANCFETDLTKTVTGVMPKIVGTSLGGGGLLFDGTTGYKTEPLTSFPQTDGPATISIWFTKHADTGIHGSALVAIGSFGFQFLSGIQMRTGGIARFSCNGYTNVETTLTNHVLYHLVQVCHTGTGGQDCYENGTLIATGTGTRSAGSALGDDLTDECLTLSRTGNADGNLQVYFHDVKFWNRTLTAAEVWSLYNPATRWSMHMNHRGVGDALAGGAPFANRNKLYGPDQHRMLGTLVRM